MNIHLSRSTQNHPWGAGMVKVGGRVEIVSSIFFRNNFLITSSKVVVTN